MESSRLPTLDEIEELTAYLPRLYAPGFSPVIRWEGGVVRPDGVMHLPYPEYDPLVREFFYKLGGEQWLDYEYNNKDAGGMLRDKPRVRTASLEDVRAMLTFCLRGERFSDGHWEEMIEKGHIRRLLERLNEIKQGMR